MHTKIWVAVHTPFFEDGSIDFDGIRRNVNSYIERGIEGVFCNGLFGEGWSVGASERIAVAKTILEEADGRLEVCSVATIGNEEETIELGKKYKEMGVGYSCLITPRRMTPEKELLRYFNRLMDAIDMPFVIFNSVTPEGNVMSPHVFAEISKNENVKILKTTVSTAINDELRRVARPGVLVADPTEEKYFVNATEHGQRVMFSDPEPYLYQTADFRPIEAYVRLIDSGNIAKAKQIFDALQPLRDLYNKWFLRPFYDGIMTMAYLKKFAEITGLVGGNVREPLKPISPEEGAEMEHQFHIAMCRVQDQLDGII